MAKYTRDGPLHGSRGKLGNIVFRQVYGETVTQLQARPSEAKPSAKQEARRLRFKEAQNYASSVLSDVLQQEVYRELGRQRRKPPNAILISDFFTPPTIDRIDDSAYAGKPGGVIRILASDDVEVTSVNVALRVAGGAPLEEGPAKRVHGVWVYTATTAAPAEDIIIEVTAMDRPRNATKETRVKTVAGAG